METKAGSILRESNGCDDGGGSNKGENDSNDDNSSKDEVVARLEQENVRLSKVIGDPENTKKVLIEEP